MTPTTEPASPADPPEAKPHLPIPAAPGPGLEPSATAGPITARCGTIAIVGRSNVGKSTLLNRLIGQKISITSRKPQTTRYQILGIHTLGDTQLVYIDTPGIEVRPRGLLNRAIHREATRALTGIDVVVFVVEPGVWNKADENVLQRLKGVGCPVILAINKVDRTKDKTRLLPLIAELREKMEFAEIIPVSAQKGTNVEAMQAVLSRLVPVGEHLFPEDRVTDRSMRFITTEIVREKLMRQLGDELPYSLSVLVDNFQEEETFCRIDATIWVERAGQKAIVIGRDGAGLKRVGSLARADLEGMLEKQIFLGLWVKVKEDWVDNPHMLRQIGLDG